MYQLITIVGNVGRDPELKYTQSGQAVCNFSVAVNKRHKPKGADEYEEKAKWFRVATWGKLAETANQYVHKGMRVLVTGEVAASAWIDKEGNPRASLEITAREVKFLSRREDADLDATVTRREVGPPVDKDGKEISFENMNMPF